MLKQPPGPRPDWPAMPLCALLVAAAGAAYSRTFSVPFLFDDTSSIVKSTTIQQWSTAFRPDVHSTAGGRPIFNVSLAIDYAISGTAVWSYHATNLAIHLLAGLTLFGILRHTLARWPRPAATLAAFSSALLWTLHPLQTESVTYVVQRAESLMGLFYLLTLYCFIRGAESEGRGKRAWYAAAVTACLLGMGTKEVMVSAPLIVLLYDRTFLAGNFRGAWRRRWRVYAGLAATWAVLPFLVLSTHGRGGSVGFGTGVPWWRYALSQFPAIVHYLRLCFWPHPLIFDYGSALVRPSLQLLPCVLAVAGLVAATLFALFRRPMIGFCGAAFFAILAPSSSVVPVATETMAEHRMYLSLIPVVVVVVMGIYRGLPRGGLALCSLLAAGLFVATWQRNETYLSDESIWADTVGRCPDNDRAHFNLGTALTREGRTADAIAQYEIALRLNPDLPEVHFNLGNALMREGRTADAVAEYEFALRLDPKHPVVHFNLATALIREGRIAEAVVQCEEALRLNPNIPEAHYDLGIALGAAGRTTDEIAQYEEAIKLDPNLAEVHSNLANALNQEGRTAEAIVQCEEALKLNPKLAEAHNNLGNALNREGRFPEALTQYDEALVLAPKSAQIHLNIAVTLLRIPGRDNEAAAHLESALRLQPGNQLARKILDRIGASKP